MISKENKTVSHVESATLRRAIHHVDPPPAAGNDRVPQGLLRSIREEYCSEPFDASYPFFQILSEGRIAVGRGKGHIDGSFVDVEVAKDGQVLRRSSPETLDAISITNQLTGESRSVLVISVRPGTCLRFRLWNVSHHRPLNDSTKWFVIGSLPEGIGPVLVDRKTYDTALAQEQLKIQAERMGSP